MLGAAGLVIAIVRKGSGVGYSIAGTAVCSISLFISAIWLFAFAGAVTAVDDAVSDINQQLDRPPAQAKPAEDRNAEDLDRIDPPSDEAPNALAENLPSWTDASKALRLGNVQILITSVTIGNVPLKQAVREGESESENELLTVWLEIKNASENKKIDYSGWMSDYASLRDIDASLTDNNDNDYRAIRFSGLLSVLGAETSASIYPRKSITDAVVFEVPVEGVEYLRLKLTGNAFGEDGEFRFQIPGRMITKR